MEARNKITSLNRDYGLWRTDTGVLSLRKVGQGVDLWIYPLKGISVGLTSAGIHISPPPGESVEKDGSQRIALTFQEALILREEAKKAGVELKVTVEPGLEGEVKALLRLFIPILCS